MGARIKAGLALSEKHIGICDYCRERFRLGSRNDFVEKAIEHYQDYLMSEEQLSGLSQDVVYTLNRHLSRYTDRIASSSFRTRSQTVSKLSLVVRYGWVNSNIDVSGTNF